MDRPLRISSTTRRAVLAAVGALAAGGAGPRSPRLTVGIGGEALTLCGEPRFAGAVSSMSFRGVEYVDRADHGRLFQSACHFDNWGECLNPTQGGASSDRRRGTSRLLRSDPAPGVWSTSTRMAYWLRPGQLCELQGRRVPAANRERLSDVVVDVEHRWGALSALNAALSTVALTTTTSHSSAVVEALTIYLPPAFSQLSVWDGARLQPAEPAAERPQPYALSTADGLHAFALFTPRGTASARFGGFQYGLVGKLNAVFRPAGDYPAGSHIYTLGWAIGSLVEVQAALARCA